MSHQVSDKEAAWGVCAALPAAGMSNCFFWDRPGRRRTKTGLRRPGLVRFHEALDDLRGEFLIPRSVIKPDRAEDLHRGP